VEIEADHKDVIHVTIFPHQYRNFPYMSLIHFFCVTSVLSQALPGFTASCFTFRFKVSKRGFLKALFEDIPKLKNPAIPRYVNEDRVNGQWPI